MNRNDFILEPTASMVVEMSKPIYHNTPLLKEFIDAFDLRSGKELVEECRKITPLCDQILLNRKFWVHDQVVEVLDRHSQAMQIVLLAGGKTPLSFQCLLSRSERIKHIYEVDLTSLSDKEELSQKLNPKLAQKISFLQYDLNQNDWLEAIIDIGFDKITPTVFIMEGISYYLTSQCLQNVIKTIQQETSQALICIDFKYPKENNANTENEKAQNQIFEFIQKVCQLDFITSYTPSSLENLLKGLATDFQYTAMDEVEKKRTGTQHFFSIQDRELIGLLCFSVMALS